jgi:hypothetical protein
MLNSISILCLRVAKGFQPNFDAINLARHDRPHRLGGRGGASIAMLLKPA